MLRFIRKRQDLNSEKEIPSEQQLIDRYKQSHDPAIVGQLIDPYTHLIFGICMKYLHDEDDSKDAVMQIYENILQDLKRTEVQNFKSWLYIVSKNHCLKQKRRTKQDLKYADTTKATSSSFFMEMEEQLSHTIDQTEKRKTEALLAAVNQLKPLQKECIELVYLQEKSYKEVVKITGYEMKKVKSYIQNGKRNLKIILGNNSEFMDLFEED